MNKYNAAIAAGYSKNTAAHHGAELDERADIYGTLERKGMTDKRMVDKHLQILEATKVVGYLHQYKNGENGVEKCEPDEAVSNEFIDVPDYPTQLRALELGYRLKGHLKDKNDPVAPNVQFNQLVQIFSPIRQEETAEIKKGTDALGVLLGEEFVNDLKKLNGNGHAPAS